VFPKPPADEVVQAADVVITMGCGDAYLLCQGKRYEDWPLDDPAGRPLDEVRLIRDELDSASRHSSRSSSHRMTPPRRGQRFV
jgi:arsenate reductase (thioredoxin)